MLGIRIQLSDIGAEAPDRGAADVTTGTIAIASSATIANAILRMAVPPSFVEPRSVDRSPGPVIGVQRPEPQIRRST